MQVHFPAGPLGAALARELLENLFVLGEAAGLVLGVDLLPVDDDVEDAAAPLDELRIDADLFLDSGRQTGGLGEVASLHAVLDEDLHGCLLRSLV